MAGLDPVQLIRDRADLVEIIGETVVLKRSGRNYLGLCPFHGERTPSFNVNPERGIFRCFGCGEGGDVFAFVQRLHNLSFPEALKLLADRYGIALGERDKEADDARKQLREVNDLAMRFFQERLRHPEAGREAREYLQGRGLPPELWEKFALGWAPGEWDGLSRHLGRHGVSIELQEAAGLARRRKDGSGAYDMFRSRVIYPITGVLGQVIAFGGRILKEAEREPKYLNSPDTALYQKGQHLYGLFQAKGAMQERDRAILVEGYMDVLALHQFGFAEAVGVLGTALTREQAKSLLRYTKRVVVSYDADRAGQLATDRGVATLEEVAPGMGLEARIIRVPSGKDPDAFLREKGALAYEGLIGSAPSLWDYLIARAIETVKGDPESGEYRQRVAEVCAPILGRIPSEIVKAEIAKRLLDGYGVNASPEQEAGLRLEIGRRMRHNKKPRFTAPGGTGVTPVRRRGDEKAETELLALMVESSEVRALVREQLAGVPFGREEYQILRERLEAWPAEQTLTWEALLREGPGEQDPRLISNLAFSADAGKWPDPAGYAEMLIHALSLNFWSLEADTFKGMVADAQETGATLAEIDELLRHYHQAFQKTLELKSQGGGLLPNRARKQREGRENHGGA